MVYLVRRGGRELDSTLVVRCDGLPLFLPAEGKNAGSRKKKSGSDQRPTYGGGQGSESAGEPNWGWWRGAITITRWWYLATRPLPYLVSQAGPLRQATWQLSEVSAVGLYNLSKLLCR